MLHSCSSQDYSIETKHFDCLVKSSNELGIDLKHELLAFEKHLIEMGVLADESGESYRHIYEEIEKTGDINFKFQYSFLDSIKNQLDTIEFIEINANCNKTEEKLEKTKKYKKSKIYQLKVAMDSIQSSGNIDISFIAAVILKVLDSEDFEHDYYKMTALLLLATTQDTDSGITRNLPPISEAEQATSIKSRNLLSVQISTDNDSIMLNENKVNIDDLSKIVKAYILSDSTNLEMPELTLVNIDLIGKTYQSRLVISMSNEKGTSYDTYIRVQNQLVEGYTKARNEKAHEYFNSEFENLSSVQQSAIKELIPLRISETEPTQ